MSQSNSAAIRRRVNLPAQQSAGANTMQQAQQGSGPVQTSNGPGFTLPQVIAVVDKRLTNLEAFMKDVKANGQMNVQVNNQHAKPNVSFSLDSDTAETSSTSYVPSSAFNDMVSEFNNRFEILAVELASLKDTIIKLQTYTMDVNKTLMEERVHVFSDLGNTTIARSDNEMNTDTSYIIGQNDTSSVDLKNLVNVELGSSM
jgi:hypothetical protein